jgi:hypothetical protein
MGYSIFTLVPKTLEKQLLTYFEANYVPFDSLFPKTTNHASFAAGKDIAYKCKYSKGALGFNYSSCIQEGERNYINMIVAMLTCDFGPRLPAGSFGTVPVMCYDGAELLYIVNKDKFPQYKREQIFTQLQKESIDYYVVDEQGQHHFRSNDWLPKKLLNKLTGMSKKDKAIVIAQLQKYRNDLLELTGVVPDHIRPTIKAPKKRKA